MENNRKQSAAFTGHRNIRQRDISGTAWRTRHSIYRLYLRGTRNFYCGMAMGFDLMAAECVLEMKEKCPRIRLCAVIPFKGQEKTFNDTDKRRYSTILSQADEVILLSAGYYKGCLLRRNDYMLEHAATLIAYHDGGYKGGTAYTCRMARKNGIPIINIY